MSPAIRTNSIRNLSYQPQDGLFLHCDFMDELREHYSRAMECEDWNLAFDLLKTMLTVQYPQID